MKTELIFKEESYKIIGACFEVYREKGCGFLEAVYQECMEIELRLQGVGLWSLRSFVAKTSPLFSSRSNHSTFQRLNVSVPIPLWLFLFVAGSLAVRVFSVFRGFKSGIQNK